MSELEDYDEQMVELLEQVQAVLEKELPKLRGAARVEKCAYLKNRLGRAKQVLRGIHQEIRDLSPDQALQWDKKAKDYDAQIGKLGQDVDWAETSAERDDIKRKGVDDMTTKEITQTAIQIQSQTVEAAQRARRVAEETIEMGNAIHSEIIKQGEQMGKIQEDVEQVESNLKRAEKQLRVFMRRLATDKIFLVFIFLIVILVIAAIVLVALRQKCIIHIGSELPKCLPGGSDPSAAPPPSAPAA
ncbi:hypothetical protein HK104_008638 [Borealophlyctis nickersoniae]|nr:hypothetical protein HK104_008638 [Borealophlyctis nickersoniae]